jgi:hypothetical protein
MSGSLTSTLTLGVGLESQAHLLSPGMAILLISVEVIFSFSEAGLRIQGLKSI